MPKESKIVRRHQDKKNAFQDRYCGHPLLAEAPGVNLTNDAMQYLGFLSAVIGTGRRRSDSARQTPTHTWRALSSKKRCAAGPSDPSRTARDVLRLRAMQRDMLVTCHIPLHVCRFHLRGDARFDV